MDFSLSEWWDSLSLIKQIYWGFAIPSTLLFIIQTLLTFFGADFDAEGDADIDVESDHGAGFQFFTLKNFVAFFTIFSWTGIACLDSDFSYGLTLIVSIIAGIAMMTLMAAIFYYFSRLTDSGTMSIKNAVGKIGEVYLPVLAKRANIGRVSIKVQGSLRELEAITDDTKDLPMGTVIEVTDVIGDNVLLITKSK